MPYWKHGLGAAVYSRVVQHSQITNAGLSRQLCKAHHFRSVSGCMQNMHRQVSQAGASSVSIQQPDTNKTHLWKPSCEVVHEDSCNQGLAKACWQAHQRVLQQSCLDNVHLVCTLRHSCRVHPMLGVRPAGQTRRVVSSIQGVSGARSQFAKPQCCRHTDTLCPAATNACNTGIASTVCRLMQACTLSGHNAQSAVQVVYALSHNAGTASPG